MKVSRGVVALFLVVLFASCSTQRGDNKYFYDVDEDNPYALYEAGTYNLEHENYFVAQQQFGKLIYEHPASELVAASMLRKAYSLYQLGKYDDTLIATDEFLELYPTHKEAPYLEYIKGLCYFTKMVDVGRDQTDARKAITAFTRVQSNYPGSQYADSAKFKIDLAYNNLAGKEMSIGRFYLKRKNYIGAINRFSTTLAQFPSSIFVEEALYRLAESFLTLGLEKEGIKYAAMLSHNYPDSEWYRKAYALYTTNNR